MSIIIIIIQLLGHRHWIDKVVNTEFIFSTEGQYTGGFAKWPDTHPGILSNFNMYSTCMYNACRGLLIL